MANILHKFFGDADLLNGIDPTTLRLGDETDFDIQPFDHSLDNVDGSSVLRGLRKVFQNPVGRAQVETIARKVIDAETFRG